MSSTVCLIPLIAALWAGTNLPELQNPWQASNNTQARFLETYYKPGVQAIDFLSPQELSGIACHDVSIVNQFLAKNNCAIQLQDQGADAVYLASILKIFLEWPEKGSKKEIFAVRTNERYPAVSMKKNFKPVNVDDDVHSKSIFMLETKNGDTVYIAHAHKKDSSPDGQIPLSGFNLVSYLMKISTLINEGECEFFDKDILTFPMIDYDEKVIQPPPKTVA